MSEILRPFELDSTEFLDQEINLALQALEKTPKARMQRELYMELGMLFVEQLLRIEEVNDQAS